MITILVNGKKEDMKKNSTVTQLIQKLNYDNKWMAVIVNEEFLAKDLQDATTINYGDKIEILSPIAGG